MHLNEPEKKSSQKQLTIRCQCSLYKDGLQLNSKKKSKLSNIVLNADKKVLKICPNSAKESEIIELSILKLRAVHKKFIDEGKVTLDFFSHTEPVIMRGLDVSAESSHRQVHFQLFINNASPENLELLLNSVAKVQKKQSTSFKKKTNDASKDKNLPPTKLIKKKPEVKQEEKVISRKDLMNLIRSDGQKDKQPQVKPIKVKQKPKFIDLLKLPQIILHQIFQFIGIRLDHRLVSRQFGQFVLKNIRYITLKDEVDEKSFNSLAKWAVNVNCRMKNVRNLSLSDRYDFQQLLINRAKTLKFSQWKEITLKNIDQLKGNRIFCLQIPYSIKFSVSSLNGLRLVELRLKGKSTIKNTAIKETDIAYLINTIYDLRVIQVSFASTSLLPLIKKPQKMKEIRIGVLNKDNADEGWRDLTRFTYLESFGIEQLYHQGVNQNTLHQGNLLKLPTSLKSLTLGSYISRTSLFQQLPYNVQTLRLVGSQYLNTIISDIYAPQLKHLDIAECPNLTPQCLEPFYHISVLTCWDQQTVEHGNRFYNPQAISIYSIR